ncbi:MAG: undecaprenyl phosphate translocase family protein, partial [Fusobacteriaceae bacterium]
MFSLFLKGIGIGVANIMPGVSGGTLAVVFNIYDKLVESVGGFLGADKQKRMEYLKFLFPIFSGATLGILLFAKILQYLYINFPKMTGFGFLLLIIPSIPLIVKGEKWNRKNSFSLLGGFIFTLIFIILGIKFGVKGENLGIEKIFTIQYGIKIFLAGSIAAGAMIIPGISGSLLLIMLGEYYNILFTINGTLKNILMFLKNFSFSGILPLLSGDNFL